MPSASKARCARRRADERDDGSFDPRGIADIEKVERDL